MCIRSVWLILAAVHAQHPWMHPDQKLGESSRLIRALVHGDLEGAAQLLAAGADPNETDNEESITTLYAAQEFIRNSKARHVMLRRLIKAGALPDQVTSDGSTTLMLAAYHGDVRSAKILLDSGADPLRPNDRGETAVSAAKRNGNEELSHILMEYVGESALRQLGHDREARLRVEL